MDKKEVAAINKHNREFVQQLSSILDTEVKYIYHHEPSRYYYGNEDGPGGNSDVTRSCYIYFTDLPITIDCDDVRRTFGKHTMETFKSSLEMNELRGGNTLYIKMKLAEYENAQQEHKKESARDELARAVGDTGVKAKNDSNHMRFKI